MRNKQTLKDSEVDIESESDKYGDQPEVFVMA